MRSWKKRPQDSSIYLTLLRKEKVLSVLYEIEENLVPRFFEAKLFLGKL